MYVYTYIEQSKILPNKVRFDDRHRPSRVNGSRARLDVLLVAVVVVSRALASKRTMKVAVCILCPAQKLPRPTHHKIHRLSRNVLLCAF